VAGGGTGISGNSVRLDNTAATFLTSATQNFTFHINTGTGNQDVTVGATGGSGGLNGTQVVSSLNSQLQAYGITASIGSSGTLQFGGSTAFTVTTTGAAGGVTTTGTGTAVNSSNYSIGLAAPAVATGTETFTVQTGSNSYNVNLTSVTGDNQADALTAINSQLAGSGVFAVKDTAGTGINLQSSNTFSVNEISLASTGTGAFSALGSQAVTAASASASSTGNALAALTALTNAIGTLGLVQGTVGAGENKLQYATNLAQSQITNVSAAESSIRDADVAAAAANLTKAQVLQQTSLAALSQANSAPQAVLALLKNF
jgi:flagellin